VTANNRLKLAARGRSAVAGVTARAPQLSRGRYAAGRRFALEHEQNMLKEPTPWQ
jgi:hypothetical protein